MTCRCNGGSCLLVGEGVFRSSGKALQIIAFWSSLYISFISYKTRKCFAGMTSPDIQNKYWKTMEEIQ